ncbi:GTP-binding protein [Pseudanabaena sp. FACHB-1277]|uniref:GTP-binding protein n=1 Tax=Pseudanabaena cinerea FACHB-1277 TaxID=2949581 RepID=A0A926UW31_9CYAN|nr:GTP-binding protein [Pseudanabaena cinerea]MBD2151888.1 GTP-binding protein [Pseudanabaena cinerea FACHB-1277]
MKVLSGVLVLCIKFLFCFANGDLRFIFQLRGKRYELNIDHRKKPIDNPIDNQLVLIRRKLDPQWLQQKLQDCLV